MITTGEFTLEASSFDGSGLIIAGGRSSLNGASFKASSFSAEGTATIQDSVFEDTPVMLNTGTVQDSEFKGVSPLNIDGNAQVRRNQMHANSLVNVSLPGYSINFDSQSFEYLRQKSFTYDPARCDAIQPVVVRCRRRNQTPTCFPPVD